MAELRARQLRELARASRDRGKDACASYRARRLPRAQRVMLHGNARMLPAAARWLHVTCDGDILSALADARLLVPPQAGEDHGPPKRARIGARLTPKQMQDEISPVLGQWMEAVRSSADLMDGYGRLAANSILFARLCEFQDGVPGAQCMPSHWSDFGSEMCSKVLTELGRLQEEVRTNTFSGDVANLRAIAECPFPRAFLDIVKEIDDFEGKPLLECVAAGVAIEQRIAQGRLPHDSGGLGQGMMASLAEKKAQEVEQFQLRVERLDSEHEQAQKREQIAANRRVPALEAAEKSLREMRAEESRIRLELAKVHAEAAQQRGILEKLMTEEGQICSQATNMFYVSVSSHLFVFSVSPRLFCCLSDIRSNFPRRKERSQRR